MKRFLIFTLTVIMLVTALCIPSFATLELPFVPASPHEHRFIDGVCYCGEECSHSYSDGVCATCGYVCSHAQLEEATYVCVTCGRDFLSLDTDIDISGNDEGFSFGEFIGLTGGALAIFVIIYAFSALKARRR